MSKTLLQKLAIKHPYYCSLSNYYSNEPHMFWSTMTNFLDEFDPSDIDMNLCFRWDITKEDYGYSAEVFILHQRKGIFAPHTIYNINDEEAIRFKKYLDRHWAKLIDMWNPITEGR